MEGSEMKEIAEKIESNLKRFNPLKRGVSMFAMHETSELEKEILNVIKEKELTYIEAYAALENVYSILEFESKFTHLKKWLI